MKLLQYPQLVFRIFGLLPLNGVDFESYKYLEILRMWLFPVPTYWTSFTLFAYFFVNILDIAKATVALFTLIGFANAAIIYTFLLYEKRKVFALINDLQILLDQSELIKIGAMLNDSLGFLCFIN